MKRDNLNLLLQRSRNNFTSNNMDRFYQFYPRLILAQLQYAYHNNSTEVVDEIMKYYLSDINFINLTINDLSELISKKFNIDAGIE